MFHWICPECGQEIAPGVKECPVCDPQASAAAPLNGPLTTAAVPRDASPPAPEPLAIPVTTPQIVLEPEVLEPEILRPEIVVPKAKAPAIQNSPEPEPETFADRLADLAESLHGERIAYDAPRIIESVAIPRHRKEEIPVVLDLAPARPLLAAAPSMKLLAEPQPPSMAAAIPARHMFQPQPDVQRAFHRAEATPPVESEASPPRIPEQPVPSAAPLLARLQSYFEAANRLMGLASSTPKPVMMENEPRITLPGPALPRELLSLQAAGLVPIGIARGRAGSSNAAKWTARLAVTAILVTAGLAATYHGMPGTLASAPLPQSSSPASTEEQSTAARKDNSHSLARFVEVSGVRFMEVNQKPQIRYLVVNHSSGPLNSLTVYVTLRASNAKPGQAPLARFTFRSPTLAAFEAKEMANPIEHVLGPLDLPDWQDLRAEVEVQ